MHLLRHIGRSRYTATLHLLGSYVSGYLPALKVIDVNSFSIYRSAHACHLGWEQGSLSVYIRLNRGLYPPGPGRGFSVERLQSAKLRRWQYEDTHMAFINAPLLGCYQAGVVSNSMIAW